MQCTILKNMILCSKFSQLYVNICIQFCRKSSCNSIEYNYLINPYSKIYINSPFSLSIQSASDLLNSDQNELKIKLSGDNIRASNNYISCRIKDKHIEITGKTCDTLENVQCSIIAPIKSDIFAKLNNDYNSDCKITDFINGKIEVDNNTGNTILKNIKSENITVRNNGGDIICEGQLQADKISLKADYNGNITIDRVFSNQLDIYCRNGLIQTKSCYSKDSKFKSSSGEMKLDNIHGSCIIIGENLSALNISGFDGVLSSDIRSCDKTNINISQITDDSHVNINENSSDNPVALSISSNVQENCMIEIKAKFFKNIIKDITIHEDEANNVQRTKVSNENSKKLKLSCPASKVILSEVSWVESMLSKNI